MSDAKVADSPYFFRSVAIVSGKGGSGKTLIATALAQGLATEGRRVLLVDADLATGGLSYYLGFEAFSRAREGVAEFIQSPSRRISPARAKEDIIRAHPEFALVNLMPVGDHRHFVTSGDQFGKDIASAIIDLQRRSYDAIIFDCRGGIDEDSINICRAVSDIVLVVETDASSIQSGQNLANVLWDSGVGQKIAGFCLNKVIDDPSSLAKTGSSFFRAEFLGAIPFDIGTVRNFIKGDLPKSTSLFSRHVFKIASRIFNDSNNLHKVRTFSPEEFSSVSLRDPNQYYGGVIVVAALVYAFIAYVLFRSGGNISRAITIAGPEDVPVLAMAFLVLASLSERVKSALGSIVRSYNDTMNRILRLFIR